ncbi:MAG: hypothetical protein KatS3mg056_1869 [Chloroflexus sp.]|nr:MAG: hypothetical protein KatS3mg056_1869 [Chloroflexus sp.]
MRRLLVLFSILLIGIVTASCARREAVLSSWAPVGPQPTILPSVTPEGPAVATTPLVAVMEPVRPTPTPALVDIAGQIDELSAQSYRTGSVSGRSFGCYAGTYSGGTWLRPGKCRA